MQMNELALAKDLRRSIAAGHPWVYDGALARGGPPVRAGELVRLRDRSGPLALGFADPGSPIRVRVLSSDPDADPGSDWAEARAARAAALRRADPRLASTSAMRLVHGEGDFMPGLVIDLYDTTAVILFDGEGAAAFWGPRLAAVAGGLARGGFALERIWQRVRRLNRYVEEQAPWQLAKDPDRAADLDRVLYTLAEGLRVVTVLLAPWIPAAAEKLLAALGTPELDLESASLGARTIGEVQPLEPLFPKHE